MLFTVRNWKQACTFAVAFACIAACQNTFAADFEKKSRSELVELEAQASALTPEPQGKSGNASIAVKNSKGIPAKSTSKPVANVTTPSASKTTTSNKASGLSSNKSSQALTEAKTNSKKVSNTVEQTATKKTEKSQDKNESKSATDDSKKPESGDAKTVSGKPSRKARKTVMLVPPPPPTMPTYVNATSPINGSFDLGLSVNYMSLDDLKFQEKTLSKKLEASKLDEQDQKRSNDEKADRAKRFVELYSEGVVSRRELETAQQDSERSIRETEQSHIKVSEIDRVLAQVKDRIKTLEATNKQFKEHAPKVSSRKGKRTR